MASAAHDVALATVGGVAILYGLFLAFAVLAGRAGLGVIVLGIGLLLLLEGAARSTRSRSDGDLRDLIPVSIAGVSSGHRRPQRI